MDNKEKNNFDNKRNIILCCQYAFLPFLGLLGAILTIQLQKWLPTPHDLPRFLNRIWTILPFIVSLLTMTVLLIFKKLYRFPPPAPKGTFILLRARYAYVGFHVAYVMLFGMVVYLLVH